MSTRTRDYTCFDLSHPPLPFVGNKMRWWRQLYNPIRELPPQTRVFDAFAGSFSISKLIQRWGNKPIITGNDCGRFYRNRLSEVENTNAILQRIVDAGGERVDHVYARYAPEIEAKIREIAESAQDRETIRTNVFCSGWGRTVRKRCQTKPYDADMCAHWLDGIEVVDVVLKGENAKDWMDFDLIVLDPPYRTSPKSWTGGDYIEKTDDAREFCAEIIKNFGGKVWLFDEPESEIMHAARNLGGVVVAYDGKQNRQCAREVLCFLDNAAREMDFPLLRYIVNKSIDNDKKKR